MTQIDCDTAWPLAAAEALRRHGSWTGRIHIQKHLFITQVMKLASPPFEFVLYDYGPYSFELDEKIVDLELFGLLSRSYPKPGYGPQYEPTFQGRKVAAGLSPRERQVAERIAQCLGARSSQVLELVATCLWVEKNEGVSRPEEVTRRIREIKPKYDEQAITTGFADAHDLVAALALSRSG